MSDPYRVLVVEDSPSIRELLVAMFRHDSRFRVVATTDTGMQATRLAASLKPDLITLDMILPDIDGLMTIRNILSHTSTRIMVVSGRVVDGAAPLAREALAAGANEVFGKHSLKDRVDMFLSSCERVCLQPATIHSEKNMLPLGQPLLAQPSVSQAPFHAPSLALAEPDRFASTGQAGISTIAHTLVKTNVPARVALIGASTGGPAAIETLLRRWKKPFPLPVVIAQHMTAGFTNDLLSWLNGLQLTPVQLAGDGELLMPGRVYLAPDHHHVEFLSENILRLVRTVAHEKLSPSVDKLFLSAAKHCGAGVVAALLTGMGDDGAAGLKALRNVGARTIVQDKETSLVFGMPGAALKLDAAQLVLSLPSLADYIYDCAHSQRRPSPKKD